MPPQAARCPVLLEAPCLLLLLLLLAFVLSLTVDACVL
jgi:hypothetical protein